MKIVADESVDFEIIISLRKNDFSVLAIDELLKGADDEKVLNFTLQENSILLTEDKDFGELVYRLNKAHLGIVLIRLSGLDSNLKSQIVLKSLKENFDSMKNSFSVISPSQTRIKK